LYVLAKEAGPTFISGANRDDYRTVGDGLFMGEMVKYAVLHVPIGFLLGLVAVNEGLLFGFLLGEVAVERGAEFFERGA
jgi:hypothetical protein